MDSSESISHTLLILSLTPTTTGAEERLMVFGPDIVKDVDGESCSPSIEIELLESILKELPSETIKVCP